MQVFRQEYKYKPFCWVRSVSGNLKTVEVWSPDCKCIYLLKIAVIKQYPLKKDILMRSTWEKKKKCFKRWYWINKKLFISSFYTSLSCCRSNHYSQKAVCIQGDTAPSSQVTPSTEGWDDPVLGEGPKTSRPEHRHRCSHLIYYTQKQRIYFWRFLLEYKVK